jgi:uncharacterized protein YjbJ (UPF0337 family)
MTRESKDLKAQIKAVREQARPRSGWFGRHRLAAAVVAALVLLVVLALLSLLRAEVEGSNGKALDAKTPDQPGAHGRRFSGCRALTATTYGVAHITRSACEHLSSAGTPLPMTNDKADQARKGLLDNVAGKAKEVVGAVSGNDELVEEGQLQQVEARDRKDAAADQAIASATREEAQQELSRAHREAAAQTNAAHAEAARDKSDIERQREREHAAAAQSADIQARQRSEAAEQRADEIADAGLRDAVAATREAESAEQEAAAESSRLQREASAAEQAAASLRAQADN